MSKKTDKKVIDGHQYEAFHWDIDTQIEIFTKLIKVFGEPLAKIIMGAAEKKKDESIEGIMKKKMSSDALSKGIAVLAQNLNHEDVKYVLEKVGSAVHCDGKPIVYKVHFMGRIGHLLKVALFCIRHQYSDFLDVLPVGVSTMGADTDPT